MLFQSFLIKYGEIGIKGKNRYVFEEALMKQIGHALQPVDGTFSVSREQGRIYVDAEGDYDYDEAVLALTRVVGIVGICPLVRVDENGFDQLAKDVLKYLDDVYPDKNKTFKVVSRRARKNFPKNSQEINADCPSRLRRDSGLHRHHRQHQRPFHSPPPISAVPRYG